MIKFVYVVSWCIVNFVQINKIHYTEKDCSYKKQFMTLDSAIRFYNKAIEIELDSDPNDSSHLTNLKIDTLEVR